MFDENKPMSLDAETMVLTLGNLGDLPVARVIRGVKLLEDKIQADFSKYDSVSGYSTNMALDGKNTQITRCRH